MRKFSFFPIVALSAIVLSSCSKLDYLTSYNFKTTPTPLESVGGEVSATINATFPKKYMKKKAVITITPVLKYNGGEAQSTSTTFQGEKVMGNGTTVGYKEGGNYTMRANFVCTEAMLNSDLLLRFKAKLGNKTVFLPNVKVGYGILATGDLSRYTLRTANPALSPDAYQRIIQQKQEAQIKYLVNQATVRSSELKTNSIQDFVKILKEINDNQETLKLQNIEVSAYASPEGRYDFNEKLAEKRQQTSADYVSQQLKRNKMQADVDTKFTAEDWEGFQQLISQSNIQDKEIILRVLSMYQDPAEREAQIRNMSVVYEDIAKGILPELRRARLIANYDVIGRSDEQIIMQFEEDAKELNIEEILYGATLQNSYIDKKKWYEKATQLYSNDSRAYNNLANMAYQIGDLETATNYLQKAKSLNSNNAEVATNEALIALAKGDIATAEEKISKGTGSNAYSEILGNLNLAKGNYAAAAANLIGVNTNSAALAQILNKDYVSAASTLEKVKNADAYTEYLKAILSARKGDTYEMKTALQNAISQEPNLRARAAKDLEFSKYESDIKSIIK